MEHYTITETHTDEGSLRCPNCGKLHYMTAFETLVRSGCDCGQPFKVETSYVHTHHQTLYLESLQTFYKTREIEFSGITDTNIDDFFVVRSRTHSGAYKHFGNGEYLLLQASTCEFGIAAYFVKCPLTPESKSEQIEKCIRLFNEAYHRRN